MDPAPAAFTVSRGARPIALVYDSPHSGRYFPPGVPLAASPIELRWAEDAYVDRLLAPAVELGVPLLSGEWARTYLDLNRDVTDIDEALLDAPWPDVVEPTDKTRRGLGLIRRYVVPGLAIYAAPLTVEDVELRIDRLYRPYHAQLDALLQEAQHDHGVAWHVNWHSMKSVGNAMTPDGPDAARADFVVSDGDGTTASASLTNTAVDALRALGYSVSVNTPYRGGAIVKRCGRPADGVHSIQIEINRRLYLDERAVTRLPSFCALQRDLLEFTATLSERAPRIG